MPESFFQDLVTESSTPLRVSSVAENLSPVEGRTAVAVDHQVINPPSAILEGTLLVFSLSLGMLLQYLPVPQM